MEDQDCGAGGSGVGRRAFVAAAGLGAAGALAPVLGNVRQARAAVLAPSTHGPRLEPGRWEVCRQLARDLLLVGPQDQDLKLQNLNVLIDNGLPKTAAPKKVLIVGAGIAGLTAAYLLERAGHQVTVIEASPDRVGGRIKTFHDTSGGSNPPFSDPAQYAEAGAMRLPSFHPLVLALIDKLGLQRRPFYLVDTEPGTGNPAADPPAVTYTSFTGKAWRNRTDPTDYRLPDPANHTWISVNGVQVRRSDYARDPRVVNAGFGLPRADQGRTVGKILDGALDPVWDYYSVRAADGQRSNKPFNEWVNGWAKLIYDFDAYSMGRFLRERAGLSEETIDAIGTIENLTSRESLAFMHSFLTRSIIDPKATFWEIAGGSWKLPDALRQQVTSPIQMNRRVTHIHHEDADPAQGQPAVRIQATGETGDAETFTGDVAIITVPFSAFRHVKVTPQLSYRKRRAVIELHYDSSTKVLLEFSKRWWEFSEDDWKRELEAIEPGLYEHYQKGTATPGNARHAAGALLGADPANGRIPADQQAAYARRARRAASSRPATHVFGGGSVTDNPNRFIYYPSHPVPGSSGGVVLASYTWSDDASRWDSMKPADRYINALNGLQDVHGDRLEVFYTGHGQTQSWLEDDHAFGEAAVFNPGQLTQLHPHIPTAEGPLHFAGEHTSLKHSWIEGALESAVRTALEIND